MVPNFSNLRRQIQKNRRPFTCCDLRLSNNLFPESRGREGKGNHLNRKLKKLQQLVVLWGQNGGKTNSPSSIICHWIRVLGSVLSRKTILGMVLRSTCNRELHLICPREPLLNAGIKRSNWIDPHCPYLPTRLGFRSVALGRSWKSAHPFNCQAL